MYNDRFERTARRTRRKALTYALLFHLLLFAALVFFGDGAWADLLPAEMAEWMDGLLGRPDVPQP